MGSHPLGAQRALPGCAGLQQLGCARACYLYEELPERERQLVPFLGPWIFYHGQPASGLPLRVLL